MELANLRDQQARLVMSDVFKLSPELMNTVCHRSAGDAKNQSTV